MMSKFISKFVVLSLSLFCAIAHAQPQNFTDPVKLTTIALGDEQGAVAVGVLQGSMSRLAFLKRTGKNAAVLTSADGSPVATPPKRLMSNCLKLALFPRCLLDCCWLRQLKKVICR